HSVITIHLPDELREFVNNALWRQIVITHLHFSSTTIFLLHPGCAANAVTPRAGSYWFSHFCHSVYRWHVWRSLQYRSVLPMMMPVQRGSVWGTVMCFSSAPPYASSVMASTGFVDRALRLPL